MIGVYKVHINKKNSLPISRVLCFLPPKEKEVSAIYLVLPSPISFSDLPLGIGRAALHAPIYMTLQPIRRTASPITTRPVSSYLAFSPLPTEVGGYSLLHYSILANSFPLGSMVPCVARTFLTP